jgi:tetratricopeptide (TPR) repeat protein
MTGNWGSRTQIPVADLADVRLGPAEVHDIIRQRLARITRRWGLKPADSHTLARQLHTSMYAPGEMILPSGVRADCLGVVVRGQVAVHVGHRGAARLVIILLPGSTFGEMMLAEGRPSNATFQALTYTEIRFLRRTSLQTMSDERRTEQQADALWNLVKGSTLSLALIMLTVLALSLPFSRKVLALVPMSIGQWCANQGYDSCTWQCWQIASNLTPSDPNPYLALGTLSFERGDMAAAERSFETARTLAPGSPEAYNNLGLIYARQGEHEKAIAAFRQALELEPGVSATEYNLAVSLQTVHNYDDALEHYQAALSLGEPQVSTLLNMAISYYEDGQSEKAEEMARAALRMDQDLAPAYTLLGAVALESRQPEKALPNLNRAIALDADYVQAYFYLGLAYKSLDQPVEAIVAFEEALINSDDEVTRVRIRRHLGELYEVQERSKAH